MLRSCWPATALKFEAIYSTSAEDQSVDKPPVSPDVQAATTTKTRGEEQAMRGLTFARIIVNNSATSSANKASSLIIIRTFEPLQRSGAWASVVCCPRTGHTGAGDVQG